MMRAQTLNFKRISSWFMTLTALRGHPKSHQRLRNGGGPRYPRNGRESLVWRMTLLWILKSTSSRKIGSQWTRGYLSQDIDEPPLSPGNMYSCQGNTLLSIQTLPSKIINSMSRNSRLSASRLPNYEKRYEIMLSGYRNLQLLQLPKKSIQ